jgi:hypothetical protein
MVSVMVNYNEGKEMVEILTVVGFPEINKCPVKPYFGLLFSLLR